MTGRTASKLMQHRKVYALAKPAGVPDNVVPHPRFGTTIKRSGVTVTSEDFKHSRSLSSAGTFWPETAIKANSEGQAAYFGAHDWYVDQLLTCARCQRPFIFYAREQQYFYEVLFVHPDVPCNYCVPCRRARRHARQRNLRAEQALAALATTQGPLTEAVVSDALLIDLAEDLLGRDQRKFKNVSLLGRVRRTITSRAALSQRDDVTALLAQLDARIADMRAPKTN